jgi:hypothetical protein
MATPLDPFSNDPSHDPSAGSGAAANGARDWVAPEAGREGYPSGPPIAGRAAPNAPGGASFGDEPVRDHAAPRLPVPLRPMTMSDLLDGAFGIIKARPGAVFAVSAAFVIPIHLIQAWLNRNVVANTSFNVIFSEPGTRPRTTAAQQNADVLVAYLGVAIGTLAVFFVGCALAKLVSSWYAGGDASAGEALRATWKATPAVLAVWAITLIPLALSNALYIGWFFLDPLVIAVAPILVIEKVGPIAAIRRSAALVGRRYWPVVLANLLATIMAGIASQVLTLLPQLLAAALGPPLDWIVLGVGQSLVALLVTPAVAGVAILLYLDLRVRTEGLDIEIDATDAFASAA